MTENYKRSESKALSRRRSLNSSRISYFIESGSDRVTVTRQPHHNCIKTAANVELLDQYITFCPKIISKLIIPKKIFITGCCLLADISGFTKLSSNLCKEGPNGIDNLRIVINHSFASFVDIIHQYGGDVIAFAGDSLLCLFLPDEHNDISSYDCCINAIKCGLYISKCHIDQTTTHVGITYGKMCIALMGGYESHYTVVVNGTCVDELDICLENAKPMEVVVSLALYHQIVENNPFAFQFLGKCKNQLECYKIIDKSPQIQLLTNHDNILRNISSDDFGTKYSPYSVDIIGGTVPTPVFQALSFGTLNHLSEIRRVTTLFCKLDSYSTTKFLDLQFLQPFFNEIQECIWKCGGMLRQFLIDDKGCVIIALWGVPTANHTNNCCMALRCSVMMKLKAIEYNEIISIGITTGSVYCGVVGGMTRRDYVAIGHTVNLSARLMCKANGHILIDQATQQKLPLSMMNNLLKVTGLKMKGIIEGTIYFKYISLELPSERLRDVREDQMVVIEEYIRKKRVEYSQALHIVLDSYKNQYTEEKNNLRFSINLNKTSLSVEPVVLDDTSECKSQTSTENNIGTNSKCNYSLIQLQATSTAEKLNNTHSHILIIQGGSGSGKTTTLNYFIRKFHEQLTKSKKGQLSQSLTIVSTPIINQLNSSQSASQSVSSSFSAFTPNANPNINNISISISNSNSNSMSNSTNLSNYPMSPSLILFIALYANLDNTPYYTIRMIFELVLQKHQSITEYYKKLYIYIQRAFPTLPLNELSNIIFPYLKEKLQLDILWEDFEKLDLNLTQVNQINFKRGSGFQTYLDHETIFPKLLAIIFELEEVLVLAIEDAHFMCQHSWKVLTSLYNSDGRCSCFLMLTVRKDPNEHIASSEQVMKFARNHREKSAVSLSHASSFMTTKSAKRLMTRFVSTQNTRLTRGYNTFIRTLNPDILQLRSMSSLSISKLLERQKIATTQDIIDAISDISQGNPSIIWKIINHLKEEREIGGLESVLQSMRDNTLILSLLKSCSYMQTIILKTASIIGEEFSTKILKLVIPDTIVPLLDSSLELLADDGFLINLDDGFYGFSSSLLKKMIYDLIPQSDAITLHADIADAIASLEVEDKSAYIFSLAYHYSISSTEPGNQILAFNYACQAADQCREVGDVYMTLAYLELAESKCTDRRGYIRLCSLIKQTITSFSAYANIKSQLDILNLMYHRIHSRSTVTYLINNSMTNYWNFITSKLFPSKVIPSG